MPDGRSDSYALIADVKTRLPCHDSAGEPGVAPGPRKSWQRKVGLKAAAIALSQKKDKGNKGVEGWIWPNVYQTLDFSEKTK